MTYPKLLRSYGEKQRSFHDFFIKLIFFEISSQNRMSILFGHTLTFLHSSKLANYIRKLSKVLYWNQTGFNVYPDCFLSCVQLNKLICAISMISVPLINFGHFPLRHGAYMCIHITIYQQNERSKKVSFQNGDQTKFV